MMENPRIFFDLLIVFVAAKLGGEIAVRLKQPAVVGEVVLGMIIGSSLLGPSEYSQVIPVVSAMGAVVLLFLVGLETDIEAIAKVGVKSALVAAFGVIVPFAMGFALMHLSGAPTVESMFLGTALVATSVGITARVLSDKGLLRRDESRIILAAAVIDDVLGLLVLSIVTAAAKAGSVPAADLLLTLGKSALFIAGAAILPGVILGRSGFRISALRHRNALLSVAIASLLAFSLLAEYFGLAAIVGAFLAGLGFANVEGHADLKRDISSIADFLTPLFFVAIGMQVDFSALLSPHILALGAAALVMAIAGKLLGCGLGAAAMGWRSALIVGLGMVPRGEVGLIVAALGKNLGAISEGLVGVIVLVSIVTTILAPPLLPVLFEMKTSVARPEAP